jgi:hypothetical protein
MGIASKQDKRGTQLSVWKRKQSERTRQQLDAALDRFESGELINLPAGQRLTRLSFAKEACVAEDTPFSRYRPGHPKEGEYRFPEEVRRFELLRKVKSRRDVGSLLKKKNAELRDTVRQLERKLEASRRVVNAQDIKISELELKVSELELRNRDLEKLYSEASKERNEAKKESKVRRRRGSGDSSK